MSRFVSQALKQRPPATVLLIAGAFLLLVPLFQWASVGLRNWAYGGSPAAHLDAPYFWAVVMLRTAGAILMAGLVLAVRRPATIWIVITATWLAGPPLTFLLTGILLLAASSGQTSLPERWTFLASSCLFPLLVTVGLLGFARVRQYYGMQSKA